MQKDLSTNRVTVRFFMPSQAVAPYISTYYLTEVAVSGDQHVGDWLHPEWANLRFVSGGDLHAAIGKDAVRATPRFIATGPTSYCAQFSAPRSRIWGIGLLPLGWARLVDASARNYADRFCDAATDPAFAGFAPLQRGIFTDQPDAAAEAARIDAHMVQMLRERSPVEDEETIRTAHAALLAEDIATVGEFADRLAISARSLERLTLRAFGFSPKLLLRRQRFLRSLAQFMLDPSLSWIRTLDCHYFDQAHFVRDFRRFMGMSPSAYAAADHPVLRAAAQARAAAAGAAVQALHVP